MNKLFVVMLILFVILLLSFSVGVFAFYLADKAPGAAPGDPNDVVIEIEPRTPVGHLMMVLTDGEGFYVADGAGIRVYDPNVVHRLVISGPNEPNGAQ